MRGTRKLVTLVVALGFLMFCGLSLFMGWGVARALSEVGWNLSDLKIAVGSGEAATVTETLKVPDFQPRKLVLDARFGDVTLHGGDGNELRVRLSKHAERNSRPEAEAAAAALRVEVRREGDVLKLVGPPQQTQQGGFHFGPNQSDRIDYDITLPVATEVDLSLTAGDLDMEGLSGAATIHSQFGDLRMRRMRGALAAEITAGSVDIAEVGADGGMVTLKSRFGPVHVADVRGGLTVRTESGDLRVERVQAGTAAVVVENRFGDIDVKEVTAGDLTVESQSGGTSLSAVQATGRLSLKGRFGGLHLDGIRAASALVELGSGDLDWSDGRIVKGLEVKSGMGGIDLTDVLGATMTVTSEQSGDISVGLPADADLAVRLESRAGDIDSDFPLSEQAGQEGRLGRTMTGRLNAGKGRLDISGRFGDIRLNRLPAGAR